jgi:hypothetical protein
MRNVNIVDFSYDHACECPINKMLLESEKQQYKKRIGEIIAFIKGHYYTDPPSEWTILEADIHENLETHHHINSCIVQVVKPDQVEKVISALKQWYVLNGLGSGFVGDDICRLLDTIRNVKL